MDHCPFCKTSEFTSTIIPSDGHNVHCNECGKYEISGTLAATEIDIDPDRLAALQKHIAKENAEGKTPQLHDGNWMEIADRNLGPALT